MDTQKKPLLPTIALLNANPDASLVPPLLGGLVGAVVAPFFFYPFSKTLWVAVELIFRPIDVVEPGDARFEEAAQTAA